MAKFKWWRKRHQRREDITTWTAPSDGTYTLEGGTTSWTFTGSPTITPPSQTWDVQITPSTTTLENTITIPYEAIEAVGTPQEFVERIIPDGYRLLEYSINMNYSSTDQNLNIATIRYRAEGIPLEVAANNSVVSAVSSALTPEILENGFSTAISNFGVVKWQ